MRLSVLAFGLALGVSVLPLAIEVQQAGKVWRIGILAGPVPGGGGPRWAPFRERLRELGYVEGQNIAIEWRSSGGRSERYPDLAAEPVRLKVDVIVAGDNPAIAAAQKATRTIPIVMVLAMDPIASGFAGSLARPGGNLTGLTVQGTDLQGKGLQILKEAVPTAYRVGILWDPTEPGRHVQAKEAEVAARALGLQAQLVEARGSAELDRVFAAMAREKLDAVRIQASGMTSAHRTRIAELALKYRLPSIGPVAWYVEAGGLLGYGGKDSDQFDRAAHYVAKILNGVNPADLPIEQVIAVRVEDQPEDGKGAGPHDPSVAAAAGGSRHRMTGIERFSAGPFRPHYDLGGRPERSCVENVTCTDLALVRNGVELRAATARGSVQPGRSVTDQNGNKDNTC